MGLTKGGRQPRPEDCLADGILTMLAAFFQSPWQAKAISPAHVPASQLV
jgi:hypothetical protein